MSQTPANIDNSGKPASGPAPESSAGACPLADEQGRPIRALCGRRAVAFAVLVGLLAGVVLSLPWDTVWTLALRRAAAILAARENPIHLSWQSIDRAAPLGLRVIGLSVDSPGWAFSPRLASLDIRLGATPLLTLKADSGGRDARLVVFQSGNFDLQGQVNLACLGRRDIRGSLDVRGHGQYLRDKGELEKAFLDLRGATAQLPDSLWLGDVSLSLEYRAGAVNIRAFTLREPVGVRAEGTARLLAEAPLSSPYAVSGELTRDRQAVAFSAEGRLGDFLGQAPAQPAFTPGPIR